MNTDTFIARQLRKWDNRRLYKSEVIQTRYEYQSHAQECTKITERDYSNDICNAKAAEIPQQENFDFGAWQTMHI